MFSKILFYTDFNRSYIQFQLLQEEFLPMQHEGFNQTKIVYAECFTDVHQCMKRISELKNWTRAQFEKLIRKHNPEWRSWHINSSAYAPPSAYRDQRLFAYSN